MTPSIQAASVETLLDAILPDAHNLDRRHVAEVVHHCIEDLRYLNDAHQRSPTLKEAEERLFRINSLARELTEALTDLSSLERVLMKQHAQRRSRSTSCQLVKDNDEVKWVSSPVGEWHQNAEGLFDEATDAPGSLANPLKALAGAATDTAETISALIATRKGRANLVAKLVTTPADYAVQKAADLLFMAGRMNEISGSDREGSPLIDVASDLWAIAVGGNYRPDLADKVKDLACSIKKRLSKGQLYTDLTTSGRHAASGGK
jgi:hypothetical protein